MTEDLDLERRELCGDGACIGVVADDGRCGECGRTKEEAAAGVDAPGAEEPTEASGNDHGNDDYDGDGSDTFEEDRRLCKDGACIGIIGENGCCKECGR